MDNARLKEGTNLPKIGLPDQPIYGFAFGGGAFDTTMYLGVVHALLVSERRAPDIVLGVSAGALAATALAEVLRAGSNLSSPQKIVEARVARFREFLNAYRDAPGELRRAFMPDLFELTGRAPLATMNSPLHCNVERNDRQRYLQSLSGLTNLINDLLSLHVDVHYLVQALYRWLNLAGAGNQSSAIKRWWCTTINFAGVLFGAFFNLWRLTPFMATCLRPKGVLKGQSASRLISVWRNRASGTGRKVTLVASFALLYVLYAFLLLLLLGATVISLCGAIWDEIRTAWGKVRPTPPLRPSSTIGRLKTFIRKSFTRRLLSRYDLLDQLSHQYPLKQLLIRLLDPVQYYGQCKLSSVIEQSIRQKDSAATREKENPKKFVDYLKGEPAIHVAPVAANISSLNVDVLPMEAQVIDGLLAANAIPVLFQPITHDELFGRDKGGDGYIDAAPVTDAPVSVLIKYLKAHAHPDVPAIFLYPVRVVPSGDAPVPLAKSIDSVVDFAERALELQRAQHTRLEHRLIKLYNQLLPKAVSKIGDDVFIAANLHSIDASRALNLNERIFSAESPSAQGEMVLEAVAMGCRRTMETILEQEIVRHADNAAIANCRDVVWGLLEREGHPSSMMAGVGLSPGPGLPEVCRHCRLSEPNQAVSQHANPKQQALRLVDSAQPSPLWPHRNGDKKNRDSPSKPSVTLARTDSSLTVPDEPWVTLVLSGGVFRGVFQIGVLAAVHQASIKPRLFAGASVGSIMAAMAARLFTIEDGTLALQRLAATFLSLDRLVVTDRFADFVRRFMVRANDVRISPKNLDQFLRRFDLQVAGDYNENARTVLAGIARLLFISPFESLDLVRAVHDERYQEAAELFRRYTAYFFERYGAGLELLGAEPLRLLIAEHILTDLEAPYGDNPSSTPFDYFRTHHDKFLLATSTNVTKGELHVFGREAQEGKPCNALLVEALLASSAFPAVFRPRRYSEVYPCDADPSAEVATRFVDGGLLDNLPLDHVVTFLHKRAQQGLLARRPKGGTVRHLLLTASLEPKAQSGNAEVCQRDWHEVARRVKELHYNRKIDMFEGAQAHFRKIVSTFGMPQRSSWQPLDLNVLTVVPKWLCGTFAFHGMLGFRYYKQAASIAHGCAMTFATLSGGGYGDAVKSHEGAFVEGRINADFLHRLNRDAIKGKPGACWFRRESTCPFSVEAIAAANRGAADPDNPPFLQETARVLPMIHEYCRRPETHERLS